MIARAEIRELFHLVDIAKRDLSGQTQRRHNARIGQLLVDMLDSHPDLNNAIETWVMNIDDDRGMWDVLGDELRSRGLL